MKPEVQQILQEMGVTQQDFLAVQQAPSFEAAKKSLEALKDKVKAAFKKLAFELHPDRTGNDPAKTAKFKLACVVKDDIEKLNVAPPRPRPMPMAMPIQVVFVQAYPGTVTTRYYPGTGATSVTYTTPMQNAWAAATMHPNGVGGTRGR